MKQPVYAPGTVIAGKYRIDKAIARGGCSIVYQGTHIDMQRPVALKIMTPDEGGDSEAWTQRFQREAKLASQLRHPNTITTYDHGHDNGLWYIIMEWVEGASLRNVVRDDGPIEPERVAHLTIQMLKSLEEAHRATILHRDMKPSNIMLTRDADDEEQVKVLDFGLAKADPSEMGGDLLKLTRDGDFVGTPRYASPEQLKGRPLTNASDIYGVGMVMWEMLTGQPAVPEVDYAVCVEHHLGRRPWTLPPGQFPAGLTMIVEKALNKDQEQRYSSCLEMRQALKAWLEMTEGPESFDLFEELDHLEAEFEHNMLADALSDAVSVVSAPLEEDELAPTKKNPTSRLSVSNLDLERVVSVTVADDASASKANVPPRVSDVAALEVDMNAMPSRRATPEPLRMAPSIAQSRRGDNSRAIGVVVALLVLAVALGVGWSMTQKDEPESPPVEKQEPEKDPVHLPTAISAEAMISHITQAGWTLKDDPVTVQADEMSQTSVDVKRGIMEANLTFYECATTSAALELESRAKSPTLAARHERLVVWLAPMGNLGKDAVSSLAKTFAEHAP